MMATTHALVGLAVASVFALVHPEQGSVAMAMAFAGGIFPDFDLYAGHRKTLHFPVYYWIPVGAAGLLLVIFPGEAIVVGLVFFLLGAALHSTMDILGGGLEFRPWQGRSERAVYNHFVQRWHRPRRWVRYDGAPEDALIGGILAVPPFVVAGAPLQWLIGGTIGVSLGYALVRRHIPILTEQAVQFVPASWIGYVPERFIDS